MVDYIEFLSESFSQIFILQCDISDHTLVHNSLVCLGQKCADKTRTSFATILVNVVTRHVYIFIIRFKLILI